MHFRELLRPGGTAYVSTPNLLTLAPPGAEKSDNPWHLKEYRAEEFRALCAASSAAWSCSASFTPACCARTSWRCERAGTAFTPPSGITRPVLRPLHAGALRARLRAAPRSPRAGARFRRGAAALSARPPLPEPPELRRGPAGLARLERAGGAVAAFAAIRPRAVPLMPAVSAAGLLGYRRRARAARAAARPGRRAGGRRAPVRRHLRAARAPGTSASGPRGCGRRWAGPCSASS